MHTCPRRAENGMDRTDGPFKNAGTDLDTYSDRGGLVGQPRGCSYCGSLPPDEFMDAVRARRPITATDKGYKLYLEVPSEKGGEIRVHSRSSTGGTAWEDLTDEEKKAVKKQWRRPAGGIFGKGEKGYYKNGRWGISAWDAITEAKFYTAHLSIEQGNEFIQLWMTKNVHWGYPPYVPLYIPHKFCDCTPGEPREKYTNCAECGQLVQPAQAI